MSQDFNLPDELLAVIPTDPYDQLDLARKITSMALASRVSKLEAETGLLKQKVYEQDRLIFELEEKAANMQHAAQEADSRLKLVLDENVCFPSIGYTCLCCFGLSFLFGVFFGLTDFVYGLVRLVDEIGAGERFIGGDREEVDP